MCWLRREFGLLLLILAVEFAPSEKHPEEVKTLEHLPGVQRGLENAVPLVDPIGTRYGRGFHKVYLSEVQAGKDECYYFDQLRVNQVLAVHYIVISTGSRGQKMSVSVSLMGPSKESMQAQRNQNQGMMAIHVQNEGDYAVCLNNSYSKLSTSSSLRVSWDLEIQPAVREDLYLLQRDLQAVKEASREYQEDSKHVEMATIKVQGKVLKVQHELWKIANNWKSDSYRIDKLESMVTRWSLIQSLVVVVIYICQCYILKGFFGVQNVARVKKKMNVQT